jgi:hypothetical protein
MALGSDLAFACAFPCSVGVFLSPFIGKRATQNGPSTSEILGAFFDMSKDFQNIKIWKLHYGSI